MGDLSINFSRREFTSPDNGDDRISPKLVKLLQEVRSLYGKPMVITSGVRSASYNDRIGGVKGSAHVPFDLGDGEGEVGHAVDIACPSSRDRYQMLPLLWTRFNRIGIGKGFIHVDTDTRKVAHVIFDYYSAPHQA